MARYGLYHGVGIIVYDLYRPIAAKRRLERTGTPPFLPAFATDMLSIAFTFCFVSVGWIAFVLPPAVLFG